MGRCCVSDEHFSEPWTGDYRAFVETCQTLVRGHWRAVREPGDDATPALIAQRADRLHVQLIPCQWFSSGAAKAALISDVVVPLIRVGGVTMVALSSAAWTTEPGSPAASELERLSNAGEPIPWFNELGLPGVKEEVGLSVQDAERHEFWHAFITRDDRVGPMVGRFEMVAGPDAISGPWVDPIREAMR